MQHFNLGHFLLIIGFLCSSGGAVYLWIDNSNKAEFILSNITGGDSFCHLNITLISADGKSGRWIIQHHGEYPLYGVSVDIVDLDRSRGLPDQPTFQQVVSIHDRSLVGDIAPAMAILLEPIDFEERDVLKFNIFIYARNGMTVQHLRMTRIENQWVYATRVFKIKKLGEPEEMIYENVDSDYPKDDNNNIEWN
jgi:hypothetical protein